MSPREYTSSGVPPTATMKAPPRLVREDQRAGAVDAGGPAIGRQCCRTVVGDEQRAGAGRLAEGIARRDFGLMPTATHEDLAPGGFGGFRRATDAEFWWLGRGDGAEANGHDFDEPRGVGVTIQLVMGGVEGS